MSRAGRPGARITLFSCGGVPCSTQYLKIKIYSCEKSWYHAPVYHFTNNACTSTSISGDWKAWNAWEKVERHPSMACNFPYLTEPRILGCHQSWELHRNANPNPGEVKAYTHAAFSSAALSPSTPSLLAQHAWPTLPYLPLPLLLQMRWDDTEQWLSIDSRPFGL